MNLDSSAPVNLKNNVWARIEAATNWKNQATRIWNLREFIERWVSRRFGSHPAQRLETSRPPGVADGHEESHSNIGSSWERRPYRTLPNPFRPSKAVIPEIGGALIKAPRAFNPDDPDSRGNTLNLRIPQPTFSHRNRALSRSLASAARRASVPRFGNLSPS